MVLSPLTKEPGLEEDTAENLLWQDSLKYTQAQLCIEPGSYFKGERNLINKRTISGLEFPSSSDNSIFY